MFSQAFKDALVNGEGVSANKVDLAYEQYMKWSPTCPGAPLAENLLPSHAPTVRSMERFDISQTPNWEAFNAAIFAKEEAERDRKNPYLPYWFNKTDDKPTIWMNDTGKLPDVSMLNLTNLFRMCCPALNSPIEDLLDLKPLEGDDLIYDEVINSMVKYTPFFVPYVGDYTEPDFRWSKALCMLAGLGIRGVRAFAKEMKKSDNGADWAFWETCTDEELKKDILQARNICYYPFGLLRLPYPQVARILESSDQPQVPVWLNALLLIHIIKHCRFTVINKNPAIICMYKGASTTMLLNEMQEIRPLREIPHSVTQRAMCDILQISLGTSKERSPIQSAAVALFGKIVPVCLPRTINLMHYLEYLPPPSVTISPANERRSENKWIDPGTKASPVGYVNIETGDVTAKSEVIGPRVLSILWPQEPVGDGEIENWASNLPTHIEAMLPHEYLRMHIRNINDLGCPAGLNGMIDSAIIMDFMRPYMYGTVLGQMLSKEYPIFAIMPMDGESKKTTNQGKTNVARILAAALAPGITPTQAIRSSGAPAQRSTAHDLEKYGTAIFDEFCLPTSVDHFLNNAGMQLLATGGKVNPGKAMENSAGISLKHPLFLVTKTCSFPEDIRNRLLPIFLDVLSDESRADDEELGLIMTGKAAMELRLCTLAYIKKHNLIEIFKEAPGCSGPWRFNAHLFMAEQFCGGDKSVICEYIERANKQYIKQLGEADESGLLEELGQTPKFDAFYFFRECSDETLLGLMQYTAVHCLRPNTAIRKLIEDGTLRSFDSTMKSHGIRERNATRFLLDALKERGAFQKSGWRLEFIPANKSSRLDKYQRPMEYILVTKSDGPMNSEGVANLMEEARVSKEDMDKQRNALILELFNSPIQKQA